MRLRLFLYLVLGCSFFIHTSFLQAADIKWMLLGVVVQKNTQSPSANMNVCLEAKSSTKQTCFTTLDNGHFRFPLEADKEYWIHLMDESKKIIESKKVSTVGKEEPEIMHLIFEY